ncbi:MAG: hypothetical protein GX571_01135 [Lentisphaerae bacterium]|jgi:hypothetical protein|nr:hypothetical protein [Lentisphaerota bacterium]
MKTLTIRASETGARLDSDVHQGGGSDDTKVLQQALDRAGVGRPLELIMDGAALVRGLRLHSDTTIRCLDRACGFYLADGANEPVVRNATYATGEIVEHDIRLLGGTYNGNCPHQEHSQPDHTPLTGMAFLGVRDLAIRDVAMLNARTYGILLANWYRVDLEDILFETEPYLMYQNQDGVHVNGPGRFLTARNIQGGSEDDFFALNADDGARGKMSEFHDEGPWINEGDITDVYVDGLIWHDSIQGVRMLSREARIDRVVIRNVVGVNSDFGFLIETFDHCARERGKGNYGHVLIENVDVRQPAPRKRECGYRMMTVSARLESLELRNVHLHDATDDRPLVEIRKLSNIRQLSVNGMSVYQGAADGGPRQDVIVVDGHVASLSIRDVDVFEEGPNGGAILHLRDGASVDRLLLDSCNLPEGKRLLAVDPGATVAKTL